MATLREYLVALGFKIDEAQYKKWLGAVANSAKSVAELGSEAVATATAIGVMTERIARNFNDMYYVAQRNETTVAGLKQIEYGFGRIGLSADQGRSAVEAFGYAMRTNPGLRGLLRGMGVNDEDPQKALTEFVGKLRQRFGPQRYFIAQQMASMFGVDETSFRGMWQNLDKLKEKQREQSTIQKQAGLDPDDMAKRSTVFIDKVDRLLERLAVLKDRIASDFIEPASKAVDFLDDLVRKITEANTASEGALGVGATIGGSGLILLMLKRWISRFLGFGGGAAAGGTATTVGAGTAAGGMGAAIGAWMLRLIPVLGALVTTLDEANKGEKDILVKDKDGNWVPGPGAPQTTLPTPQRRTTSSSKVWGDDEAIAAGIYDPPALKTGGGKPVTVNQRTEINIAPGPTARATADAVADRQQRINGDLVRNTAGATR